MYEHITGESNCAILSTSVVLPNLAEAVYEPLTAPQGSLHPTPTADLCSSPWSSVSRCEVTASGSDLHFPAYAGCLSQVFFSLSFAAVDTFLLTAMAYDRFVAICHPLHYMVIMNPQFCGLLLLASWVLTLLHALSHSLMVLRLSFCSQVQIPQFFCDLDQVIQLACSDTFLNELVIYLAAGVVGMIPLSGVLYSYSKIVSSVLKISSASGRYKAFSTCGSHLSVVSLFYGTALGVYLSSAATHDSRDSAIASVMYTVVTPTLNPFIYSLRNKDIKQALV
ncbi:olfactory receptor 1571-like, partial [Talpa occidentalis]|uniref:olfactory receptor 1571-like n=1 Tax=Talpa occidentalis TaxID=50954 RepID=UPI0023F826E3